MKDKIDFFYHKYFSEIMTGILFSLVVITILLVFGIYNGNVQRENIVNNGNLTNIKVDSLRDQHDYTSKRSDSIQTSLIKKLDIINNK